MKWILLFLCIAYASSQNVEDDEFKCNLKICGSELLNFEHFGFGTLFRKLELASFCVKNCTPPVVHEFFQGLIYAVTKRIPGHCSGTECVDKNRFVALAKCVEHQAWPLLQCSKRLIDLAQNILTKKPEEARINTTCSVVMETTQCIEEYLQQCGEDPFQLVKEIIGDLVHAAINSYCHPEYRKEGLILKRTTAEPTVEGPTADALYEKPHPQFVKGYRGDDASTFALSLLCLLGCLLFTALYHSSPSLGYL